MHYPYLPRNNHLLLHAPCLYSRYWTCFWDTTKPFEGRKGAEDTYYVKFKIEKDRNYVSESDFDLYDDKGTQVSIEEFKDNSDLSYEVWFSGQAAKKYQLVYHDQDYDKKFSFEFHTPNQKSVEENQAKSLKHI